MSIQRDGSGLLWLCCDDCDEESAEGDDDDFQAVVDEAKRDGWAIRQVWSPVHRTYVWTHICPDCMGKAP